MVQGESNPRPPHKVLVAAIAVFVTAAFVLILALAISDSSSPATGAADSGAYAEALATALAGADAAIGERLIAENDCASCHLTGDGQTAPLFDGLASVAGARRPPLSAEQYLYEAIVLPAAHLVDGYANAMPNNYGERFSLTDIGHMIARLLSLTGD